MVNLYFFYLKKFHKDYEKENKEFIKKLKKFMGDKYDKTLDFDLPNLEWVNDFLKIAYEKYSQYYIDGYLRVWMPQDIDIEPWKGYDYPHKFNIIGDVESPNGVYYLSDIEKYIEYKYGISDDKLYEFLISNQYIEGRYWERVWDFQIDRNNKNKLSRGESEYGMVATEKINHILNILEKDFKNDIFINGDSGLLVYVDYYKEIDF